ncbi:AraC family transcriptional regulator [Antricoccus suffuscus]|uniref:AraC family transcriptional regulator n=1 Tax=Antricoccus suffuscus TaxID=1629062 RepID=A0A2T1A3G9_9ACTN|nr:DUF6597 domain-containing transcriptional factor [Antricoccus suffuscus]PRZ43152.1 AraC family transcriptional regulator [Antricoccus suffuscus]
MMLDRESKTMVAGFSRPAPDGHDRPAPTYREHTEVARPDLIRCWWTHRLPPHSGASRILPDNCADLIVRDDGAAWLVGPATGPDLFELEGRFNLRAIRINPAALATVTRLDADELVDQRLGFGEIFTPSVARALTDAVWAVDEHTVRRIFADREAIPSLAEGFRMLECHPGQDINRIAERLGHSPRNFRRLMKRNAGLGPKTIQRVSRFRSFLDAAERAGDVASLAGLAFAAGYVDQAHLTRDSTALSGLPPRALLVERSSGR